MNELDELVYAMEDLNILDIKVFMNKGDTGGPQGKFDEGPSNIKEEHLEDNNFVQKEKRTKDFVQQYHKNGSKYMPNRLQTIIEYKRLNKMVNKNKEDIYKLDILITKISLLEYKFIIQLKQRAGIK